MKRNGTNIYFGMTSTKNLAIFLLAFFVGSRFILLALEAKRKSTKHNSQMKAILCLAFTVFAIAIYNVVDVEIAHSFTFQIYISFQKEPQICPRR